MKTEHFFVVQILLGDAWIDVKTYLEHDRHAAVAERDALNKKCDARMVYRRVESTDVSFHHHEP